MSSRYFAIVTCMPYHYFYVHRINTSHKYTPRASCDDVVGSFHSTTQFTCRKKAIFDSFNYSRFPYVWISTVFHGLHYGRLCSSFAERVLSLKYCYHSTWISSENIQNKSICNLLQALQLKYVKRVSVLNLRPLFSFFMFIESLGAKSHLVIHLIYYFQALT